ncbi:MAG: TraB/GumN family protein [Chromatiaceae bacterium]
MRGRRNALRAIWVLLGLLWVGFAAASGVPFDKGLLFEVRGENGNPNYLFGTIHSEDPRVLALPTPVQDAFDGARGFVMEVIPDSAAVIKSMMGMVFTDGRCLKDVIGMPLYSDTLKAMKSRGMSEAAIKDFKPWAVVTLLSLPPAETGQFLDMQLYKDALADGKAVTGLETIDEQLGVFDDLSEQDQIALLRETLQAQDELPEVFTRLIGAYLERDLGELMRLSELYLQGGDTALAERFRTAALDRRNRRMADRLTSLLEKGGYFVAVGALHLPGEGGVLQRLVDAGFSVRAVY